MHVAAVLLALAPLEGPAGIDPAAEVQKLLDGYRAAHEAWIAPFKNAKSDEEAMKLPPLKSEEDPANGYLPKFRDLASWAQGTDSALTALLWIAEKGRRVAKGGPEAALDAVNRIVAEHSASPRLEDFAQDLQHARWQFPRDAVVKALRTLVEKSPHKVVRGAASLSLAAMWSGDWPPEEPEEGAEGAASESAEDAWKREWKEAGTLLLKAEGECAGTPWAERARGMIFEREKLQVGKKAPDFEGVDVEGKPFKLSDYRGKVVVLDFWGFG